MFLESLQAPAVLDYELIIDRRTVADVQLGRGREAVSGISNLSSPTPPSTAALSSSYKDSTCIMTQGNWNG